MNIAKEKFIPAKVKVKKTAVGFGLFADANIKKWDFVIEYTGKILTTKDADKIGGMYLFEISSKRTIDGRSRQNIARYINHSCKPNCIAEIKNGRVFIYAINNIKKDEELGYDYGIDFFREFIKPKGCKCRAKKHLY